MSPRISIRVLAGQSDQRLVALVREGHERAFEALVHRYRRPLLRYCRRLRLSDARAEDVLQQAFLQAWLALGRGVEVRELKPWLYRIVHNAAVNSMRGPLDSHAQLSDAPLARAAIAGDSELERRAALRDALADVAALPRLQQQAIFLTAVDGQTHDEVASALGISHGALRGLLYRARSSLRSAAAALTPPPLVAWAAGRAGGAAAGPLSTERLAELATGAGGAGLAGLALKGAVVAVTAAVVASGAAVVSQRHDATARHLGQGPSAPAGDAPAASAAASTLPASTATALLRRERATEQRQRRDAGEHRRVQRRRDGREGRRGDDTAESRTRSDGGGGRESRRDASGEPLGTDGSGDPTGSGDPGGSGDRSTGGGDGSGVSGASAPSTDGASSAGSSLATATSDGISGDGRGGSGSGDGQIESQPLAGEAQRDGDGTSGTSGGSTDG
jgi:RNA polymerase sigma factor (sigma-70 family)